MSCQWKTVRAVVLALSIPFLLTSPSLAATAEQWRTRSIYQLVTDRFALSNDSGLLCDASATRYCGGSWKGITNHLDYIQKMGFDAIWISPVVVNIEGNTPKGEAYHGYWTKDFNALNSHFGTAADLMELSNALHSRDMYLMFDVVVNHMTAVGTPPNFTGFSPYNTQASFHPFCFIQDDRNQTDVEQCWLGDDLVAHPDINTEDPNIVSSLNSWVNTLVSQHQVDGLRIDTVKHIRKDFWPEFARSAGVFTLGEVLNGDVSYAAGYTQVLDSILDYPTYFTLFRAFTSTSGNLTTFTETVVATQHAYKNGVINAGSFIENHDQPRLQSITQDQALVKNAMTWPFVQDGIPILYYGQEQGYTGGPVPENREALWFTAYETQKPLVAHVTALNAARKLAISANKNFITSPLTFIPQSNRAMIVASKPPLLALLTNVGSSSSGGGSWTVPDGTFKRNQALVNILTCTKMQATSSGSLTVASKNGMPQVLMPASVLSASGSLCSSLATSSAVAGSKGSNGLAGVVLVVGLVLAGKL